MYIYIKSFNRPFYLDRCLQSISMHVNGNDRLIVLDDGTPEKYLNKILDRYPQVDLRLSNNGDKLKLDLLRTGNFSAMGRLCENHYDFWKREIAADAQEYFIVLEEDTWFISDISLDAVEQELIKENVSMLKLWWCNKFVPPTPFKSTDNLSFYKHPPVSDLWSYWNIWLQCMAIYRKDFWTAVTQNVHDMVNEPLQLKYAKQYLDNYPEAVFANTNIRTVSQGWAVTSRNDTSYHSMGDAQYLFIDALNDAWLADNFDVMSGYPLDLPTSALLTAAKKYISKQHLNTWEQWHAQQSYIANE